MFELLVMLHKDVGEWPGRRDNIVHMPDNRIFHWLGIFHKWEDRSYESSDMGYCWEHGWSFSIG